MSFSSPLRVIYEFFQAIKNYKTLVTIPMALIFVNVPKCHMNFASFYKFMSQMCFLFMISKCEMYEL